MKFSTCHRQTPMLPSTPPPTCPRARSCWGPVEWQGVNCREDGGELLPERHVLGKQISSAFEEAPVEDEPRLQDADSLPFLD